MNENYQSNKYDTEDTARLMTAAANADEKGSILMILGGAAGILLIGIGIFLIVI